MSDRIDQLRKIPAVSELLQQCLQSDWAANYVHDDLVEAIRAELAELRQQMKQEQRLAPDTNRVIAAVHHRLERSDQVSLCKVINATGIIVHTNLGRAPLAKAAMERIGDLAGYSNLEFDISRGKRGNRDTHLEKQF